MNDSFLKTPVEEDKINNHYQQLLAQQKKANEPHPSVMKEQPHVAPNNAGRKPEGPFGTGIMKMSDIISYLEAIDNELQDMAAAKEDDLMSAPAGMPPVESSGSNEDLLEIMNKICTPMLVMQGYENEIGDKIQDDLVESTGTFTEQNVIKFDDQTRMSQLIAIAAKAIARKKNTEKWRTYAEAEKIATRTALEIQKEEYDEAKALVTQYLVKVSTTNASSVARKAANDLLPATNY